MSLHSLHRGRLPVPERRFSASMLLPVLWPPKTTRSRRVIDVEPRVIAALRRCRAAQQMERRVAGIAWLGTQDLVFTTETGEPIDGRTLIRKWFRPLLKRAGLPPIRLHDLRHTYASIALANGTHPKVVQEALGHSTIAITMDLRLNFLVGADLQRAEGQLLLRSRDWSLHRRRHIGLLAGRTTARFPRPGTDHGRRT